MKHKNKAIALIVSMPFSMGATWLYAGDENIFFLCGMVYIVGAFFIRNLKDK